MADRLKVFLDDSGAYRWHKIAANGKLIASSGESFSSAWNATRAAIRANPDAELDTDQPGDDEPA